MPSRILARKIGRLRPVGFEWAGEREGPWHLMRDGLGREVVPTGYGSLLEMQRAGVLEGRALAYAERLMHSLAIDEW